MGMFDEIKDKAKELLGQHEDKVEELSDQGLDKAAEIANDKTGGQHADTIEQGREAADQQVGTEEGGLV